MANVKVTPSTVMVEMGAEKSWYFPIESEPDGAKPVYGAKVDMGHFVKAALTLNIASASIPGDNISQVEVEEFVSGQLDTETTMSSLEVNAKIYGHMYSDTEGEISAAGDSAPNGGYACIQHILKKDKSKVYRATCLRKVTAMAGSEKQNANTKTPGSLTFANNAISFKVLPDNTGVWRNREDFNTMDEAIAFINSIFSAAEAATT